LALSLSPRPAGWAITRDPFGYRTVALSARSATSLLGNFISHREPNLRYLGLDCMANIASGTRPAASGRLRARRGQAHWSMPLGALRATDVHAAVTSLDGVKKHTDTILNALRDRDISVRRRGLDLLYSMCDESNSRRIVAEYAAGSAAPAHV